jgi:uncharacterized protein YfdQ (DUF2303 family)
MTDTPKTGGFSLEYANEDNQTTARKLEIFDRFNLEIPPYLYAATATIECRLRVKQANGKIQFKVLMNRPDLIMEAAFADMSHRIEAETGLTPYRGVF